VLWIVPTLMSDPANEHDDGDTVADDAAWEELGHELDQWIDLDRRATLWWRDDDAAAVTPSLEQLLALRAEHEVPLALAIIPDQLQVNLTLRLGHAEGVVAIQHGYRHRNHAGKGEGAWECGDHRPIEEVEADLAAGRRRLSEVFGERFLPVLAPPWNRISQRVAGRLPALGFIGLSAFGTRSSAEPAPGLVQVNAHCDPMRWKEGGRFKGTPKALDNLISHLRARRTGASDPLEATGILTHHLALDQHAWAFVSELMRRTSAHPGARWQHPRQVFRR
jgi:hypothetical protein